jgi:hypothetical protein
MGRLRLVRGPRPAQPRQSCGRRSHLDLPAEGERSYRQPGQHSTVVDRCLRLTSVIAPTRKVIQVGRRPIFSERTEYPKTSLLDRRHEARQQSGCNEYFAGSRHTGLLLCLDRKKIQERQKSVTMLGKRREFSDFEEENCLRHLNPLV